MATSLSAAASTSSTSDENSKGLFLFDFDGVVCDSCDECTVSALRTLQSLKVLNDHRMVSDNKKSSNDDSYPPDWLFAKMREIRPAIEVGWQIPVLLSVFWEQQQSEKMMTIPEIIANYETLVHGWLAKHKLSEQEMVQCFGGVRDQWIQNDMNSWLDINKFYSQVPESLNSCVGKSVLVTTKQQRFAIALCRHAGVSVESLPDKSIYGLGQYKKKSDVIFEEMTNGGYKKRNTHFFEDRWPTLVKCLDDDRLHGVNLYLCAWGYCTSEELKKAEAEPRVTVLQLDEFASLVQGK